MKLRILFVDDEPLILQGLQRLLHHMRQEWEMEFCESGLEAMVRMAAKPYDVVVADMRMPGMNGAELLNQVMRRYPKTVRLILSGHADKDLILRCVGSTHQYLAKPCDADVLKGAIQRAAVLEKTLQTETLRKLTAQLDRLPCLPALYLQITERLQSPEASLEEVAALVAKDIGMTAKILQLVNSAFFGARRQVADVGEAIRLLGMDTIKSLAFSVQAFSQFETIRLPGVSMPRLWAHSLQTAAAAKAIAQAEQADPKLAEEAYCAGLLHDAGKLVLAANFESMYLEAVELAKRETMFLSAAEQQLFGATHADVGGYLLALWGLPVPVVEAVALHHQPSGCPAAAFQPLTAVHVANVLVNHANTDPEGLPLGQTDECYLSELGLDGRVSAWRTAVQSSLAEVRRR
jgi:HD-like signal output (HDOD) protein